MNCKAIAAQRRFRTAVPERVSTWRLRLSATPPRRREVHPSPDSVSLPGGPLDADQTQPGGKWLALSGYVIRERLKSHLRVRCQRAAL
jgi:hypothetical protein